MREKDFGCWNSYTWNDYYDFVRKTGLGLQKIGFEKGDNIALISDNIPEMLFIAIGAQAVGGISAAIYQTSLPEEIAQILEYMDVTMVFCDDQEQVDKIVEIRDRVPGVKKVIYEDPRGMRGYRTDDWFMFIEDLYRLGDEVHAEDPDLFESLVDQGTADDVCHLCLTSGTTGLPKGTMLTHRNYINMGLQLTEVDPLEDTDEYLSFLPFAWIGEQMNSFGVAMATGITINFPESVETTMEDLKEIGPHFMFGAPRIYETIRSQIWLKIDESYWLNRKVYNYFMKIGEKAAGYRMTGRSMPPGLRFKAWLGNQIMFRPSDQPDRSVAPAPGLHRRGCPGAGAVHLLPGHRGQPETDLRPDRDRRYRLHAPGRRRAARYGGQTPAQHRVQNFRRRRDPLPITLGDARLLQAARKDGGAAGRRLAALRRCRLYRRERSSGGHRSRCRM